MVIDESAAGSVVGNNGTRGTVRWMAPELMYPDKFGFTTECQIRLPSRGTDIYALGMTIFEVRSFQSPVPSSIEKRNRRQVITGCRPFNDINVEGAVTYKVLEGHRPDRQPSCFTDPLWELLMATWLEEHGPEPPKRPPTSTIRNRLNEEVNNWGKSIVPPVANTDRASYRAWDDSGSDNRTSGSCTNLRTKQPIAILRSLPTAQIFSRPKQTKTMYRVPVVV